MSSIYYSITKKLSSIFNNILDFSRIGNLVFTNHRYSTKELTDRAVILASTAAMGYIGAREDVTEKLNCPAAVSITTGALIGFTLSHTYVIAPLIYKRIQFKKSCDQTKTKISELLNKIELNYSEEITSDETKAKFAELKKDIENKIDQIYKVDHSTAKRANSSVTWGKRTQQLNNIYESLAVDILELTPSSEQDDRIPQRFCA